MQDGTRCSELAQRVELLMRGDVRAADQSPAPVSQHPESACQPTTALRRRLPESASLLIVDLSFAREMYRHPGDGIPRIQLPVLCECGGRPTVPHENVTAPA